MIGKYLFKNNLKLIIGSGGTSQKGYIASDVDWLDITKWWHWARNFRPNSIKNMLAEHVFEHLSEKQIIKSLKLIWFYLKDGGRIRIAVPDKNRQDKKYSRLVKPPIDGHLSYMNVDDLSKILKEIGFEVRPLEYFNDKGKFIHNKWDDKDGVIRRSFKYDKQKNFKNGKLHYTSLIIDAIKK